MWQKALQMLFHLYGGMNPAAFGITVRYWTLPAHRSGTERGQSVHATCMETWMLLHVSQLLLT